MCPSARRIDSMENPLRCRYHPPNKSNLSLAEIPRAVNIGALIDETASMLATHHIESPHLTAELLVAHVTGRKRLELHLSRHDTLSAEKIPHVRELARRRATGEPLQYVTGVAEFCGLELFVDRRVLIPRPETEILVETVCQRLRSSRHAQRSANPRILDLCTGSGCIAIALAKRVRGALVTAVDISEEALVVARENAKRHNVGDMIEFVRGDLFAPLPVNAHFDVVVSNPPYVATGLLSVLQREVREHEPRVALVSGPSGLEVIEKIIRQAPRFLLSSGSLALEIGFDQRERVNQLMDENDYKEVEFVQDLQGHDRVVVAKIRETKPAVFADQGRQTL
jgi:release factor glutamine methyltransferase